jgi:hypothetical protein
MKVTTSIPWAITFLLTLSSPSFANDSQYLIKEMEALRDSLKIDDSARMNLTLRLADLYFDVSIQEGKGEDSVALKKDRLKALELYRHSLDGTDGVKKVTGINRVKIQFQMGRLLSRLNEGKMAESYYLDILANPDSPKKMIEQSALALAEWNEEETKYPQAKIYYDRAVANCSDLNSCNYANYRLGWLYYKDTKLDEAIATMAKSIWSEKGVIRENSLTDLLLFVSNKETDGYKELEMIKKISAEAKRPELVRSLVEAFYVAGNRSAGSNTLAELNKVDPNVYYEVRLLEEFYGFRKWNKVEEYLTILEKRKASDIPLKPEESKEVLAIMRRFIVQVDAEMQVVKDLDTFLKRSINIYLTFYPKDELRQKMQSGWLAVVQDKNQKLAKLDAWIKEDTAAGVPLSDIRKLRQTRLALAQEQKNSKLVVEDSLAIAEILKGSKEADEFLYVAARELYEQKNYDQALPYFQTIVTNTKTNQEIGKWSILSQNLILDIYNNKKNYDGIVAQVAHWKELTKDLAANDEIVKENKSMEQILVQAQFEKAFLLKESPLALESFYAFCLNDQYVEKSCPNAKVLSIKFKNQEKLVKVLEKTHDDTALLAEYELMGRFSDAAHLHEKVELSGKPNAEAFLKTAFLFELDQDFKERDRVLNLMVDSFKHEKALPAELEKPMYAALEEADLLTEKALLMPWSINQKLKLATRLEMEKPSTAAQEALASLKDGSGPVWSKAILGKLESEFNKTNKIKFYGTRSEVLFKQRTTAIDKFAALAKPMLDSADLETRVYILHMLKLTYKNIANEILNTPIPNGLDEKTMAAVAAKISTLADPFDRVNEDYDKLLTEQLTAITDLPQREAVSKNIANNPQSYANFIKIPEDMAKVVAKKEVVTIDRNAALDLRKKLLTDPEDKKTLLSLKEFYTKNASSRLAAYYAERADNLKQVE